LILSQFSLVRVFVLCIAFALATTFAHAQREDNTPADGAKPPTKLDVLDDLDTYFVPDKNGVLVPALPGFKYKELIRAYNIARGLADAQPDVPDFAIQSVTIDGQLVATHAALIMNVTLSTLEDGWIRVPLSMAGASISGNVTFTGDARWMIQYRSSDVDGGHILWINSVKDSEYKVTLKFVLPVQKLEDDIRLTIKAPVSPTCKTTVTFPSNVKTVDLLDLTEKPDLTDKPTTLVMQDRRITHTNNGGPIQLIGRTSVQATKSTPTVITATGDLKVSIKGTARLLDIDASLEMRSFGGEMTSFTILLPPKMEWSPTNVRDYTVEVLKEDGGAKQLLKVTLNKPTNGPVEIQLRASSAQGVALDQQVELGGFEVVEAVQQNGEINVTVDGDYLIDWSHNSSIVPADSVDGMGTRFEYISQPCSLKMRLRSKQRRIAVNVQHVVYLGAENANLVSTLKYQIEGVKTTLLMIDVEGWVIDRVIPDDLIDPEKLEAVKDVLQIPLSMQTQATAPGEIEIRIQAHLAVDNDDGNVDLLMPLVSADEQTPASIIIVPDDNVELNPTFESLGELLEETIIPQVELLTRQQSPLYFRALRGLSRGRFVGTIKQRSREVFADLTALTTIKDGLVTTTQSLEFGILYEPLDELILDVPAALHVAGKINYFLDGSPVNPTELSESLNNRTKRVAVDLFSAKRMGQRTLRVVHTMALPDSESSAQRQLHVPLVIPANGYVTKFLKNQVEFEVSQPLVAISIDERWAEPPYTTDTAPATRESRLTLAASVAVESVSLELATRIVETIQGTDVAMLWLQTWQVASKTRNRAVFRVMSTRRELEIQLPEKAVVDDAAVDGHRADYQTTSDGLQIVVKNMSRDSEHVIEVWYSYPDNSLRNGVVTQSPPTIVGVEQFKLFYWHLAIPQEYHVLGHAEDLTPELEWDWRGTHWGPRANRTEKELEQFFGATSQQTLPTATHQYLYSGYGNVPVVSVNTASRTNLMLMFSGIAMCVAFGLMYFPGTRNAFLIVGGVVVVVGLSILYPEAASLGIQASTLGIVLSMFGFLLAKYIGLQATSTVPHSGAHSAMDSKTVAGPVLYPAADPTATTATAPAGMVAPVEPKP
jgi:hypothetical protein